MTPFTLPPEGSVVRVADRRVLVAARRRRARRRAAAAVTTTVLMVVTVTLLLVALPSRGTQIGTAGAAPRVQRGTRSAPAARVSTTAVATTAVATTAVATTAVATTAVAKSVASTIAAAGWTTPATADPGTLPQTRQLPEAAGAQFDAGVAGLWQAIVTGNAQDAMPFFFPLSAYIQVKGISDPQHDYDTRLIPAYKNDIAAYHRQLGSGASSAQFKSFNVPNAAQWIVPGVEYNKGSYWRVYGSTLTYTLHGRTSSFSIYSLISWRGEWYVVHVGPPTN